MKVQSVTSSYQDCETGRESILHFISVFVFKTCLAYSLIKSKFDFWCFISMDGVTVG